MKKSMPFSVKATERSRPPDLSFLFQSDRTWLMGVLNVTPDSFFAGSRARSETSALTLAEQSITEGVDILDIGGESTRPGADRISADEELRRVMPVVEAIHERWPDTPLSIDTQKAEIAAKALDAGVTVVNDISALRNDPAMADVVAQSGAPVVLMHMQGTPQTMQQEPTYQDVVSDVKAFFEERLQYATSHHIREDRILLDPGIGFGKKLNHNIELLKHLSKFLSLGRPLLVGVSRKSFIGRLLGNEDAPLPPEQRLEGTLAANLWAVQQGARGLRVHDVGATRSALVLWEGLRGA